MLKSKISNFKIIAAIFTFALIVYVILSFTPIGLKFINHKISYAIYCIIIALGICWLAMLFKRRFARFKALKVISIIFFIYDYWHINIRRNEQGIFCRY
ncbi:MAG: hypothetical protein FWF08_03650 [Oscillospiraceae bacterium]|nr:hypothetical protein [Oscillospiraceae bacterium]